MKSLFRIAVLSVLAAALPGLHAADASGIWKGAFEFNGDSVPLTFHLAVAGDAVTGTVEGLPTTPAEIHDGKVDGDAISFWVNTDYQGETYKLVYKGKMSGEAAAEQIDFSFGTEAGDWNASLTAKKSGDAGSLPPGPDVSGMWKGAFDFEGKSVPLTFNLKSADGAVSGTVEGLPTTPADIHEGKLDGDTVSFWINSDYQGQTYKLVYRGKITAGQIDFTFGTEDGSWGSQLTAKKS